MTLYKISFRVLFRDRPTFSSVSLCFDMSQLVSQDHAIVCCEVESTLEEKHERNTAAREIRSKNKVIDSTCWSRSNDLWVMSPTRFLCYKYYNEPSAYIYRAQPQNLTNFYKITHSTPLLTRHTLCYFTFTLSETEN